MTLPMSSPYLSFQPRVFVVQDPLRHSVAPGGTRPKFDLTPAKEFGELTFCLDWADTRHGFDCDQLLWKLRAALRGFTADDFLLMTGNPTAMALAAIVAAENSGGRLRLLVWTKEGPSEGYYNVCDIDINAQPHTI